MPPVTSLTERAPDGELVSAVDACVHYGAAVALGAHVARARSGASRWRWSGPTAAARPRCSRCWPACGPPTDGSVTVDGAVAMVTQHRHHHRWMPLTVDEVLRMGRYRTRGLLGRLRADDRRPIAEAAERLEVSTCGGARSATCRAGSSSACSWPRRSPPNPTCCCSTSRSPGSTCRASCGSST